MRRIGIIAAVLALAACGGESKSITAPPPVGPPDSLPTERHINPSVRPYKVSMKQAGAITSNVRASLVRASTFNGVVEENWGPDSIVYRVDTSGTVVLTLYAQARDLSSPDSAGVPNATVTWSVFSDRYSHDPKLGDPSLGLTTPQTTTDAGGNTTNNFAFSAEGLAANGGYYYIDLSIQDSTGNFNKSGRFYILANQPPTWLAYWDGKFASFDTLSTVVPTVDGSVTLDVAAHVTFPLVEGADTRLMDNLGIGHVEADGCDIQGTVVVCPSTALPVQVRVWPNLSNLPDSVDSSQFNPEAHTFFQLTTS